MRPFALEAGVVLLEEVRASDTLAIYEYCQDPVFERFLTTPWPYERRHAEGFVNRLVPEWWESGEELTWALRRHEGAPLMGVIGLRLRGLPQLGFWLGDDNRGHGYMPAAVGAVVDWAFSNGIETVQWECLIDNVASMAVARKTGFTYAGVAAASVRSRDGSRPDSWTGLLHAGDTREPKPGWPA